MAQKSVFDTRYYSTSVFIIFNLLVGLWILQKWKLTPLHNSLMVKTKSGRMGFDSEWMLGDCFGNLHCKSSESGWGKSVSIIKTLRKIFGYPYHLRQVCNYNSRSPCKERSHLPIVNSKLVVFRTTSIQSGHLQLVINCDSCITSGNDRYFAKVANDLCSSKLELTQLRCSYFTIMALRSYSYKSW